jgi:hypothetical protein
MTLQTDSVEIEEQTPNHFALLGDQHRVESRQRLEEHIDA